MIKREWFLAMALTGLAGWQVQARECEGGDIDGSAFFMMMTGSGSGGGSCSSSGSSGFPASASDLRNGNVPGASGSDCSGGGSFIALQTVWAGSDTDKTGFEACVLPGQPPDCPVTVYTDFKIKTEYYQSLQGSSPTRQRVISQSSQLTKTCVPEWTFSDLRSGFTSSTPNCSYSSTLPLNPVDSECDSRIGTFDPFEGPTIESCTMGANGPIRVRTTSGLGDQYQKTTEEFANPWTEEEFISAAESCLPTDSASMEWRGNPAWALRKMGGDHKRIRIFRMWYRFVVKGIPGRSYEISYYMWEQNSTTGVQTVTRQVYTHVASGKWELVPSAAGIQVDAPVLNIPCDQGGYTAKGIFKPIYWKLL